MTGAVVSSPGSNAAEAPAQAPAPPHPPSKAHSHEKAVIIAVVSVTIILVLGLLMAVYANRLFNGQSQPETRDYNGFEFTRGENSWFTLWERDNLTYTLEFRHPPWDVENLSVSGSIDARFQMPYMFVTYDPSTESSKQTSFVAVAAYDISAMLKSMFKREVIAACTKNVTDACSNRDIVTCATNASVVYLKLSNQTGIFLDGNCATFQGSEENLTRAVDKGIYQWLGIITK